MWIVINKPGSKNGAFMSIVAKDQQGKPSGLTPDSYVSVRSRREDDIAYFFPEKEIHNGAANGTLDGDYQFRCFATRHEVALFLTTYALNDTATNFKNSIAGDADLCSAAHSIWGTLSKLQPVQPYTYHRTQYRQGSLWPGQNQPPRSVTASSWDRAGQRLDPFCDFCGMRVGVSGLDVDGVCADCAAEVEAQDEIEAGDGKACWSCGSDAGDLNDDGLCPECVVNYAGVDPDLLAQLRDGF